MDYRTSVLHEIGNVETELSFINTLVKKRQAIELDDIEIRAAVLSLSTIYNGIEKVFIHILRERDHERIEGSNWHAVLIERSIRAHLISEETRNELKGFMAFRHFVRHAYSFEIDAIAIHKIIEQCPALVMRIKQEMMTAIEEREPERNSTVKIDGR